MTTHFQCTIRPDQTNNPCPHRNNCPGENVPARHLAPSEVQNFSRGMCAPIFLRENLRNPLKIRVLRIDGLVSLKAHFAPKVAFHVVAFHFRKDFVGASRCTWVYVAHDKRLDITGCRKCAVVSLECRLAVQLTEREQPLPGVATKG